MDLSGDLPVTLVIKAPSQRVGDQTVDCMLGWTVKKLKQHLTSVYPSQPKENHQKLIYSGKLLADHLTLKEVLRQFEDGSTKHTVHLVCSQSHPESQSSQNNNCPAGETEGLRYRGSSSHSNRNPSPSSSSSSLTSSPASSTQPSPSPENLNNLYNTFNGQYGPGGQMAWTGHYPGQMPGDFAQFSANMMASMGIAPGVAAMYTPQQQLWLQQAYAQYMAQYMQYYMQAGYLTPPNTPVTQADAANQNADGNIRPDNEAQNGGGEVVEEDDEFGQRDWLDYVYTICRFMVLMGIVYFYSSLSRFLMVFFFFVFVYICQMGWYRLPGMRRREQADQAENRNAEGVQEADNNAAEAEQQAEGDQAAAADDTTDDSNNPQPSPEPAGPGRLQVALTFFTTFFTSLFPQPPEAVNIN